MFGIPDLTGSLAFAVLSAAVGSSFQFGYSTGIVNAPCETMKQWLNDSAAVHAGYHYLTPAQILLRWSFVVSSWAVGGIIGGFLTAFISVYFGRRGGMIFNNALAIVAGLLMGFSKFFSSWEMLLIGRFVIGVNNGINTGLAPMYLAEIAPLRWRGAVATINQLFITIAILTSQIFGLPEVLGNARHWDLLFGFVLVPAVFQILTLPFCPESPRFLFLHRERQDEARRSLMRLRNSNKIADEIQDMRCEREAIRQQQQQNFTNVNMLTKILHDPVQRWALTLAVAMMISQQITGINAVMYYSTSTFSSQLGTMTESAAQLTTIMIGFINVLVTVASLLVVDRIGRRTLHMFGLFGMAANTIVLVVAFLLVQDHSVMWMSYVATTAVILFVIFFALGPGPVPWFYVDELFTQSSRSTAVGVAVTIDWTVNFVVAMFFELLRVQLGAYVFSIFAMTSLFFGFFTWRYVPETKRKTFDEIQKELKEQLRQRGLRYTGGFIP